MRGRRVFLAVLMWLFGTRAMAQQGHKEDLKAGLKGEYYNGTNFEQKVLTRIDPQLNFNWRESSPASGVNQSYYSVRWTGKLVAPVSGRYTFNALVDDGIRIWVGNRKVMDVWQLNDSKTFTGSIVLEGGHVYDLRIDYFNDMLEGEIKLYWVRPDAKKSFFGRFGNDPGEPITARYYKQPAPPVSAAPKPAPLPPAVAVATPAKPASRPPVVASIIPKPAASKRPAAPLPEPVAKPVASVVLAKEPVAAPPVMAAPVKETTAKTPPVVDRPTVLQHVQFEQSSYVLLPESMPELDKLVQTLRTNPQWRIELLGHTDNVGDARVNQTLSEYRTRVVRNYLTRHGIAEDRIEIKGYGGSRPLADNNTEAGRAQNRRVEFVLN